MVSTTIYNVVYLYTQCKMQYVDLIGNTPLIDLSCMVPNNKNVKLFAKVEYFNPGYSIKDRIVRNIINNAIDCGQLVPGMTVVAASSGNTGASTAMLCAMLGYKCIVTTSPACSPEKMDTIRAYGATLVVSESGIVDENDPKHYIQLAKQIVGHDNKYFDINQYETCQNPQINYETLGPEIWSETGHKITHFVAAASTGGTICGTGKYLKEMNKDIRVVLADVPGSIFMSNDTGDNGGPILVEGVGKKTNVPTTMDLNIVNSVIHVTNKEAFEMCRIMAKDQGILAGGSSGLNVAAALKLCNTIKPGSVVVTVLPDSGLKYSTKIYNDKWLNSVST